MRMRYRHLSGLLGFFLLPAVVLAQEKLPQPDDTAAIVREMQSCSSQVAALERLDCYDRLLVPARPDFTGALVKAQSQGEAWRRAIDQEKQRTGHGTEFLITQSDGDRPSVIITTPALGNVPPRPILMFSCVDNITRMQIALSQPKHDSDIDLTLITEAGAMQTRWFIRENGYLLEASRGLAGIDEIKHLFGAKTLTVESGTNGVSEKMTFTIAGLAQTIMPLRAACHWAG